MLLEKRSNKFPDTPKKIDKSSPKEPRRISFVANKSVEGTAKIMYLV